MTITVSTSTVTIIDSNGKIATFPFNSMVARKVSDTEIHIDSMYTNDLFKSNIADMNLAMIANTAIIAPTVNDDTGDGYIVGDIWYDSVLDAYYQTTDVTAAAAVWVPVADLDTVIADYTRKLVEHMNGTSGMF